MDTNDVFGMLIFFCLFEGIGGAAFGAGIRGLRQRDFSGMFFLIWGAGFAGIPLVIGTITFLANRQPTYFYAQVFVLLIAIVTVALLPRDFLQTRGDAGAEGGAIVRAIIAMMGGVVVLLNLRQGIGIPMLIGAFLRFSARSFSFALPSVYYVRNNDLVVGYSRLKSLLWATKNVRA